MHLSSTAEIRIRNTKAGRDASLLYSWNQHQKHKSWTWSISPHLLARQILHPSRHLKSPADQIPRGQRWPDSVSAPTWPASLVDVVGLGGVLVGGAPVHHLWGLVVGRWWLVFVHGVAEGVLVLEEVAAQVAKVAVLHNHVQLPCWKAQKLQSGQVQKPVEVQKLRFGEAQKLQSGEVQKLQLRYRNFSLERHRNFSLERYRNFSLERYRNWFWRGTETSVWRGTETSVWRGTETSGWRGTETLVWRGTETGFGEVQKLVWERYRNFSLDRYRKQEFVLKWYRNFSFGEVQTLQLWRGTETSVMESYRNYHPGEVQKLQLWRVAETSVLESYRNLSYGRVQEFQLWRGTQTLGEVHKL